MAICTNTMVHGTCDTASKSRRRTAPASLSSSPKIWGDPQTSPIFFEVERCRASFMQTVNRDRLSADSRITLTTFVEGAYLPWTKEERRASTSKGHHQVS